MTQKSLSLFPPKMFESDFVETWTTREKCANCKLEFRGIPGKNQSLCRPHVLPCGHNICEGCLFSGPRSQCGQCQQEILPRRRSRAYFPLNYYMYGRLQYTGYILPSDLPLTPKSTDQNDNLYECIECNRKCAKSVCIQCSVPYCQPCFNHVHKLGKALKGHCLRKAESSRHLSDLKVARCPLHGKNCDHYCLDCERVFCFLCVAFAHATHKTISVYEENKKYLPKIASLIEMVTSAKEFNQESLKITKSMEKRFEDYGTEAVDAVSKFFLNIHTSLQLMERKVMMDIKSNLLTPFAEIQLTLRTLNDSEKTLTEVKETLQDHLRNPPSAVLLNGAFIEKINSILETLPCGARFDGYQENPVCFEELKSAQKQIESCFKLTFKDNKFRSRTSTFFGSTNQDLSTTAGSTISIPLSSFCPSNNDTTQDMQNETATSIRLVNRKKRTITSYKGRVSHIKTPDCFFVQTEEFYDKLDLFRVACIQAALTSARPDEIVINQIYLVRADETYWYRGKVERKFAPDVYNTFMIDFGQTLQITKDKFRNLPKDLLESPPAGATKCRLFDLAPTGGEWGDSAKGFMVEILQNKTLDVLVLRKPSTKDDSTTVDLIVSYLQYPASVRDALIFSGYGSEPKPSDRLHSENGRLFNLMRSRLLAAKSKAKLYKAVLKTGTVFPVKILNIESPSEFYVTEENYVKAMDKLLEQMNDEYQDGKNHEKIYCPQLHLPCAVQLSSGDWYRGVIAEVIGHGKVQVRLVDQGRMERVELKQLRVLDERFFTSNELSYQCSLADIEPLQENNYIWTEECIAEFKRHAKNPVMNMGIISSEHFRYKVNLYIVKRSMDVSVNALLVKTNHAISTGYESQQLEIAKENIVEGVKVKNDEDADDFAAAVKKTESKSIKPKVRTKQEIKIVHIETPGEFYIHLQQHLEGIKKLHMELQIAESKWKVEPIDWKVGDKCLVLAVVMKGTTLEQWYRGDIRAVDDEKQMYTVFLIDHGKTIYHVPKNKLAKLETPFSRVASAAIKCHLACVQPTGGLDTWSMSSVDELRTMVERYVRLAGSIQGSSEGSIPVILWGLMENCDPLSAKTHKWTNINKILVNNGYAHLTGKFAEFGDTEDITDYLAKQDEGELLSDWLKEFCSSMDQAEINKKMEADELSEDCTLSDKLTNLKLSNMVDVQGESIAAYLPPVPIEKTMFVGCPTYVDYDGVVYLHDAELEDSFKQMQLAINREYENSEPESFNWYEGQSCLARFKTDGKFYRAQIMRIKSDSLVKVRFVDFGNVEDCETDQLRKIIACPHIPMQAVPYVVDGIAPLDGQKNFPTKLLDLIHVLLVEKLCPIQVSLGEENKSIKKCSIRFGTSDLAEYLIQNKMVSRTCRNSFLKERPVRDVKLSPEGYKKMFEIKEINDLLQTPIRSSSESSDDEQIYHGITVETSDNELTITTVNDDTSSIGSFSPKDTSSVKSHFDGIDQFRIYELPANAGSFKCEVVFIRSPTVINIYPHIADHQQCVRRMERSIQSHARKAPELTNFEENTACLALFRDDNLWYRALIRSFDPEDGAEIVFVDYLNADRVQPKRILRCPPELLDKPLRHIQVKLFGLKPNPQLPPREIKRKLSEILADRKIYVRIIKRNEDSSIEVELYDPEGDRKSVIYESMIKSGHYLRVA